MFSISDYDYSLPLELIAQTAAHPPESCKLLIYDKKTHTIHDHIFSDITTLIDPNTLIIFNNTKVLKARLHFSEISESSELSSHTSKQQLEIFYLNNINNSLYTFNALIKPGKKFKVGKTLQFNDHVSFHIDAITEEWRQITCSHPIQKILQQYGQMPLPPYISYDKSKENDYQPIFASKVGSVAAPTASLHFTKDLISKLQAQGVQTTYTTLHVGLGTFKQVDTKNIKSYNIHAEQIEIDISLFERITIHKLANKPLLAVGTTVTRTLESLPYLWKILQYKYNISSLSKNDWKEDSRFQTENWDKDVFSFWNTLSSDITLEQAKKYIWSLKFQDWNLRLTFKSKLYIYPSFTYRIIDQLITNFHLPKSSLLMLVAWFVGYEQMKHIYDHAISQQYRFYSFGDAIRIK